MAVDDARDIAFVGKIEMVDVRKKERTLKK